MARFLQNQYKATILSLMIFLFPNVCFAEQINIQKAFRYESYSKSQLFSNFKKSLFGRLEENRDMLMQDSREEKGKIKYREITKGREREISDIKRDTLGRIFINSKIDALSKTPIGIKAERLVNKISSHTRIKYKKSKDQKSRFYFPGEIDENDKGEYGISLSASLYPDLNSLRDDFSVGIKGHYGMLESALFFRPDTNKTKINFQYKNFAVWAGYKNEEKGSFGLLFKKKF